MGEGGGQGVWLLSMHSFCPHENTNGSIFMRVITAALMKLRTVTPSPEKTVCTSLSGLVLGFEPVLQSLMEGSFKTLEDSRTR